MQIDSKVVKAIEGGTNGWREFYDSLPLGESAQKIADQHEHAGLSLILFSVYIDDRAWNGSSHENALKKMEKVKKAVRKALGYTVP